MVDDDTYCVRPQMLKQITTINILQGPLYTRRMKSIPVDKNDTDLEKIDKMWTGEGDANFSKLSRVYLVFSGHKSVQVASCLVYFFHFLLWSPSREAVAGVQ